ncbi:Protein of unknown function [Bacillus cereus]|nr:Protein of unknown function [Bacillus cereus]
MSDSIAIDLERGLFHHSGGR